MWCLGRRLWTGCIGHRRSCSLRLGVRGVGGARRRCVFGGWPGGRARGIGAWVGGRSRGGGGGGGGGGVGGGGGGGGGWGGGGGGGGGTGRVERGWGRRRGLGWRSGL